MKITPSCYAHFINRLSCLANGRLCVLLEVLKFLMVIKFILKILLKKGRLLYKIIK